MKRKIALSIMFILSVGFASLTVSDAPAEAQGNRRLTSDTGVITLGPNQILRVTVNLISGNNNAGVQFRRIGYGQQSCSGGVCQHVITSPGLGGGPHIVAPNEAVWLDIDRTPGESAVRALVISNRPVQVNAQIINTISGEVSANLILPYIEGGN